MVVLNRTCKTCKFFEKWDGVITAERGDCNVNPPDAIGKRGETVAEAPECRFWKVRS